MNTTEIKALVAAKLAGQGSAIDAGNAIPAVIEALCDHIDVPVGCTKLDKIAEDYGTPVEISDKLFYGIRESILLIDIDGYKYPRISVDKTLIPLNATCFACFGTIGYDDDGTISEYSVIILYTFNNKKYLQWLES